MPNFEEIENMSKVMPPEYEDLATVVKRGPERTTGVIGVVVDCLPPTKTRGTQFQMTVTLKDLSDLPQGLRVKVFESYLDAFPPGIRVGDVFVFQHLKITEWNGKIVGNANRVTRFIVFARDYIVEPGFRVGYSVPDSTLKHFSSHEKFRPSIHLQQWVITLKNKFPDIPSIPSAADIKPPPPSLPSQKSAQNPEAVPKSAENPEPMSDKQEVLNPHTAKWKFLQNRKYSLIQDILQGDRINGPWGKFYDLAGEIVKMEMQPTERGVLDLYITDYTHNGNLPYITSGSFVPQGEAPRDPHWKGPDGRFTLKIELMPPHSMWTAEHLKEGDYVYLKNVLVKWSQRQPYRFESNIWPDQDNREKVNVFPLYVTELKSDLDDRRALYGKKDVPKRSGGVSKKEKRAKRKKKKDLGDAQQQNEESDSETASKRSKRQKTAESDDVSSVTDLVNPYVRCDYKDKPLSSLDKIINNPALLESRSNGETFQYPFTNVNHHAKLRVVDYYPHDLEKFSVKLEDPKFSQPGQWEWRFWLVLAEPESGSENPATITVEVFRQEAEYFLKMPACDLSKSENLENLKKMFRLFSADLVDVKDKFLASHPHIKSDASFTTRSYNVEGLCKPFELCIAEYGKRVPVENSEGVAGEEAGEKTKWERAFKLFGAQLVDCGGPE